MPTEEYYPDIDSLEKKKDVEGLIKALENKDYLLRKEAARSLKKVGDARAVEPLIKSLKYESWQGKHALLSSVREYSAEALSSIGDEQAIEPLIQSVKEDADDEVRWRSVYALGKIGNYRAVETLIEALKSDSWLVREHAAKALGSIGDRDGVEPLISALDDDEWRVRKQAVIALGLIADERAIKPLISHLSYEDIDVKRKTIEILANMGDIAYEPLMELFKGDDWYTRSKAAQVLGKIGDQRAVDIFIDTLSKRKKEDRNRYIRGRVAEALGNLGDPRAVNPLIEAMDDETIYVRKRAEEALIKIRLREYPGEFIEFNDGTISFYFPGDWTLKTRAPGEKFEGHNSDKSIKLLLFRKSFLEEVNLEDLIKIWDEIFDYQKIVTNTKYTWRTGNTSIFLIIGDKLDSDNAIMVVGFKSDELFYYLHFTTNLDVTLRDQEDIDLIINTFRILV